MTIGNIHACGLLMKFYSEMSWFYQYLSGIMKVKAFTFSNLYQLTTYDLNINQTIVIEFCDIS